MKQLTWQLLADTSLTDVSSPSKLGSAVCVAEPNSLEKSYVQLHLVHLLLSRPSQECRHLRLTRQRGKQACPDLDLRRLSCHTEMFCLC